MTPLSIKVMGPLSADERAALRRIADTYREHADGKLPLDDALRRIGDIVAEDDARRAREGRG